MSNAPALSAEGRPIGLLVSVAVCTLLHGLFVAAWARGGVPMPSLIAAGYGVVTVTGLAAGVGLWRRAPWLRGFALAWGLVAGALGVVRALDSTAGAPLRYSVAVVMPLLFLGLVRQMLAAARRAGWRPVRAGA